jgi:hypothetical protein
VTCEIQACASKTQQWDRQRIDTLITLITKGGMGCWWSGSSGKRVYLANIRPFFKTPLPQKKKKKKKEEWERRKTGPD